MKKIINTILGVLVRWSWKVTDVIKEFMNNLDFIFHWKKNKQEMEDFDRERLSHQKEREKYKNELIDVHQELNNLSTKYVDKKNQLSAVEQKLNESNLKYQEELHEFMDLSVKFDELQEQGVIKDKEIHNFEILIRRLEKKVERRDTTIQELRLMVRKLRKEEVILREDIKKSRETIKFLKSKLPKATLEEIKAYTFSQKEVLKRSKNDRKD